MPDVRFLLSVLLQYSHCFKSTYQTPSRKSSYSTSQHSLLHYVYSHCDIFQLNILSRLEITLKDERGRGVITGLHVPQYMG